MESFNRFLESSWATVALAAMVFVLALPGLIAMPVLDRDEGRFAEASSEMLETGDFVVIRFHDELRNKKPVAIHWMQAAAVGVTSSAQERDIGAFRLPSLLGAMLAAVATFWIGSTLFNRRAGFIAGLLIGSCLLLTTEAHIAKTDAAQCGFLALGMLALARLRDGTGGKAMGILFWFCLAVGVLLKGVIAPLVVGTTVLALLIWERNGKAPRGQRWNAEWAGPLTYWVGISLFCVMTIPWFIAVQISTDGEFLFEAAAVDLGQKIVSAAEGHKGPPLMHLAALPVLFWPGTLLLVPGIWLGVSNVLNMRKGNGSKKKAVASVTREDRAWRFLACWIVPSWIVFELAPTKLFHYTLPMYPAFALMAGAAADGWFTNGEWSRGKLLSLILFGVVALIFAGLATPWALSAIRADAAADFGPHLADRVAYEWTAAWDATGIGLWVTLLIVFAAGATIYLVIRRNAMGLLAGIVACSVVAGVGYRAAVLPNQSWMLSTEASLSAWRELCALPEGTARWEKSGCAQQAINGRAFIPPKAVHAIAFAEPSLVFELGNKITLPPVSKAEIPSVAEDNRPAWLINIGEPEGREALDQLVKAAAAADRCIRFARRHAFNYSNGDPSILVAAVVEPAGCPSAPPPPALRETEDEDLPPPLDN
jgi:4-amino-4-deoxy-L-arabinose transferase-like glycosyltransferase